MWNDTRSILLSRLCVIVFLVILAAVAASAPYLTNLLIEYSGADIGAMRTYFLITAYAGCVPAAVLLISLLLLLRRIETGRVFVPVNVRSLRVISWCCFFGAALCAVSAVYYYPWAFIAVAAAFIGLIVRVVKNVFARAVALQDEADYTV